MAVAFSICCWICADYGISLVLTEGTGGKHMAHSKHPIGLAIDIRKRDLPKAAIANFDAELRESLGEQYDIVNEETHWHIEFDPEY